MKILKSYPLSFSPSLKPKEQEQILDFLFEKMNKSYESFFSDVEKERLPKLKINNRLSNAFGRFCYFNSKTDNGVIEMSGRFMKAAMETNGWDRAVFVLKHEMVHWYLREKGLPFNDGDKDFEQKLAEVGAISSGVTNKNKQFVPSFGSENTFKVRSICQKCGYEFFSNRRANIRYTHKNCGGALKDKDFVLLDKED